MISVVMPAFNAEEYLVPAIDSILQQTYEQFELIIVDDGSTDSTPDIARGYAERDRRVKVIAGDHTGNGGARNRGLNEAQYPWIAVMDADDIALPERLETQLQAAEADPEVIVWGSAAYHIGADARVLSLFNVGPGSKEEFWVMRYSAQVVQVIHPTAFYRRDIAMQIGGYDNHFKVSTDAEFFDRMAVHGPFVTLPVPLMKHRMHSSSLTISRYREQRLNARYVADRQRRRLAGLQPIALDEFVEQLHCAPLWQRARLLQMDMEDLFYIEAGLAYGQHHVVKACEFFMLSALINPFYAIPKVWRSRFSRQSRSAIRISA